MAAPAALAVASAWGGASVAAADDEDLFIVKTALSPKAFKDFELVEKKMLTHNTARLRFALPAHHELGLTTASCLVARAEIDGEPNSRTTACAVFGTAIQPLQARRLYGPTHQLLGSMIKDFLTSW